MRIQAQGREVWLSYSTNVHPAENLADLKKMLSENVGPVMKAGLGDAPVHAVNLRLGIKQADEILAHETLPSNSVLSDKILSAPPSPACVELQQTLAANKLRVVSINGFPILDFHAPRVKEMVYSPPWTDGGRSLYTQKIAKALTHLMGDLKEAAVSVPSGTFKGYSDGEEVKSQCAHILTECTRELRRLEKLTGKTVVIGLEPEPYTTGESMDEFIEYYNKYILLSAREKFPAQLGIHANEAEDLARKFITINLDLCHQAVEYEVPVEDLKKLKSEGIRVTGLHLSAALQLPEPAKNAAALAQLEAMNEPRYLHQIVGKLRDGSMKRYEDLPEFSKLKAGKLRNAPKLEEFADVRCHFHVPLFADFPGPLASTRDVVGPAARYAAKEGITDNFIVETYTWGVLNQLAQSGNASAKAVVGANGLDVNAGLAKELQWAKAQLQA